MFNDSFTGNKSVVDLNYYNVGGIPTFALHRHRGSAAQGRSKPKPSCLLHVFWSVVPINAMCSCRVSRRVASGAMSPMLHDITIQEPLVRVWFVFVSHINPGFYRYTASGM